MQDKNNIEDWSDSQVKELAGEFESALNKRITTALVPLSWFALAVIIAATFLTYKYYINMAKIDQIESNLSTINTELASNRQRLNLLDEKIKPKNMDHALRGFMDEQIKNGPQVRGVDGKLNKER